MSDCRFGVSPVNYPDPDPDYKYEIYLGDIFNCFGEMFFFNIFSEFIGFFFTPLCEKDF